MANNRAIEYLDRRMGETAQRGINSSSMARNRLARPLQHAADKMFVKNITKSQKLAKAAKKK